MIDKILGWLIDVAKVSPDIFLKITTFCFVFGFTAISLCENIFIRMALTFCGCIVFGALLVIAVA